MGEQTVNIHTFRHRSDTRLLRVASAQLPRLSETERADALPFVGRLIEQHQRSG
jgi:hypothetical protein